MAIGGVGGGRRLLSEINVTPLVDVMLVLLIIFMVTAPLMHEGIRVEVPTASGKAIEENSEQMLTLTITKDQKIYIGKNEFDPQELVEKLKAIYQERQNKEIFIQADKSVPYGFVVGTISDVQKAGVQKLGIITQPEPVPAKGKK